jgi:nitrate/nitrite transporter NarK
MSIALAVGTLFYGPLDRIFNTRKWVIMIGNVIVLATCIAMAINLPSDPFWAMIGFVVIGFFGASYAVQMAHGKAFVPAHLTGRGVTLLNFCSIGGAGIFQWLSGPVVEAYTVSGNPVIQYEALFVFYSILLAVAISAYAFAKDAKP